MKLLAMKPTLISVEPYGERMMKAVFSNGRMMFFANEDLDYKLLMDLEKVEQELEAIRRRE
jgi:hypothetical protein